MKIIKRDLVIIGGGSAGMRSALSAYEKDPTLSILLIAKKPLGVGGVTAQAFSDRMAFHATLSYTLPPQKNYLYHALDIYKIGGEVSDYNLAEILAKNSESAIQYLISIGVPFVRDKEGKIDQFLTDGSIYPRACYVGPNTAIEIAKALHRKIKETKIEVMENVMAYDFILKGNRAVALKAIDTSTQEILVIQAKAFILAAGGAGEIYHQNVFTSEMTGDGYAMALRAGAELVNMEFMQIGLCHPNILFAESGSIFRALPKIVDENGKEFLLDYLEGEDRENLCALEFKKGAHWPVSYESPTKVIDLAIYYHTLLGHKVYMDFNNNPSYLIFEHIPDEILRWSEKVGKEIFKDTKPFERLRIINPTIIEWLKKYGIDLEKDRLPVQNALQHFQGGVTQVFGKIAGESAIEFAKNKDFVEISEEDLKEEIKTIGIPAEKARKRIKDIMSSYGFLVRIEEGINKGLIELSEIRKEGIALDEHGPSYYLETLNMLDVAEVILTAIKIRDESRGPHLRFIKFEPPVMEFLPKKENWNKYIVIKKKNGKLSYEIREPVRPREDIK
ncbi:MAG: succinate dehydrogenase [Dictyoglomus sp. NZ13-RE01]|nr:MAG: succinate dehydrogenase [Dictyoglomus sp. NZ13-RE01]